MRHCVWERVAIDDLLLRSRGMPAVSGKEPHGRLQRRRSHWSHSSSHKEPLQVLTQRLFDISSVQTRSSFYVSLLFRAAELRPDLSCLWKLLGDACTAVSTVSPNRAQLLVPAPLVGLDSNTQSQVLDQAQALKVGERYDHKQAPTVTESCIKGQQCNHCSLFVEQYSMGYKPCGRNKLIPVKFIFTVCNNRAKPLVFICTLHYLYLTRLVYLTLFCTVLIYFKCSYCFYLILF